jgi:hypothetical protein
VTTIGAAEVCAALREAGINVTPDQIKCDAREHRTLAVLPGERVAWFPDSDEGRGRLTVERHALRLITARCSFAVPRILYESPSGFDVRAIVPGIVDPWRIFKQAQTDPALGRKIGAAAGRILVEQHSLIHYADVQSVLPEQVAWPLPRAWLMERLPDVVADKALLADIVATLDAYEAVVVHKDDRALVHTDLGFHNMALDPETLDVRGVFDYDSAAWADRHHDFQYFIYLPGREEVLEAALAVYEPATGIKIDRRRVLLYNAACAIGFMAYRHGIPPDQNWCGRTLEGDLEWTIGAMARVNE